MKIKHYCPLYGEVEIEISDDAVLKAVEEKMDAKIEVAKSALETKIAAIKPK